MQSSRESNAPGFWFLLLWWAIGANTDIDNSFLVALLICLNLWLAVKLFARARFRIPGNAWSLLAQALCCAMAYLAFGGGGLVLNFVIVCAIGLPVVFFGTGLRMLADRFAFVERQVREWAPHVAVFCFSTPLLFLLSAGHDYVQSTIVALMLLGFLSVALIIGWGFGAQPGPSRHDARYAESDDHRRAGSTYEQ
jgi:hypothetical protein